jgi:hypothetical protein
LLFLLLLLAGKSICQPRQISPEIQRKYLHVKTGILADRGYSIADIQDTKGLHFQAAPDSVTPGRLYWLKIIVENTGPSARNYVLEILPQLKNTLYYFHPEDRKWITSRSDALNNTGSRLLGRHLVSFAGQSNTTVFVKLDLTGLDFPDQKVSLEIHFKPESAAARHEQNIHTAWICCMVVLLVFMLNNLYVYFSFGDKAVLYYLIAQLGGMVYITSYRWIFHEISPLRLFSIGVHGKIVLYGINNVVMHLAILLTLCGLAAFSRTSLDTKTRLPGYDRALRYGIWSYGLLTLGAMAVNVSGYDLEYHTLAYDNLFCLLLILLMILTGVAGYLRKLPFASTFLLANVLPLTFTLGIPVFHLIFSRQNKENLWIPELAAMAQALAFSIALVARTKAIQKELWAAALNNRQLVFDLKESGYRVQLTQLEIAKINADIDSEKIKNELLEQTLAANQRELASSTLYMVQKNELLNHLKAQIQLLSKPNPSTSQGLKTMSSLIDSSTRLDGDWKKFKMHFEQVHPHFFEELKANHPQLTMKETRLYAYFHMQLSHKEIAALLNIDPASVRRAKTRLLKKMALPETE